MSFLVDTNILIDFLGAPSPWTEWSRQAVMTVGARRSLLINPIIYAELSVGYESSAILDDALASFERDDLPWAAAFHAGRAFLAYRRAGGARTAPLPDFYIGAHAMVAHHGVMTRDPKPYRTYFPSVELIAPDSL